MSDGPLGPAALQGHVDAVLATLPDRARRCCLVYYRTDGTAAITYVERIGAHWTAGAILSHAPTDGWTGQVALKGVW